MPDSVKMLVLALFLCKNLFGIIKSRIFTSPLALFSFCEKELFLINGEAAQKINQKDYSDSILTRRKRDGEKDGSMGGKKLVNTFEDKMQTNLKRGPSYFVRQVARSVCSRSEH